MEKASDHEGRERKARPAKLAAREERLAAALRENLRKRKARARAREAAGEPAGDTNGEPDPA